MGDCILFLDTTGFIHPTTPTVWVMAVVVGLVFQTYQRY